VSAEAPADRFARFRLIPWWDQDRVQAARVVVVGAGALGNEVIKNCALFGIGHLVVIDMDAIELSNLSRSVLFRAGDAGAPKAEVAARAAGELFPGLRVRAIAGDLNHDVGAGLFRWADVVIGALDNREARLSINRACYRAGTPWIDGGIEGLQGVARAFEPPEGPCYECTMSDADWRALEQRRSCALLAREVVELGHVPTTPTTASVIGGIQVQEALKLLHGRPALSGQGYVFDGVGHASYLTTYQRLPDCLSHDPLPRLVAKERTAAEATLGEALDWAREELGPEARLELLRELLLELECADCGDVERPLRPLTSLSERDAECPHCGARRAPRLFHAVSGDEDFLDVTLARVGLPPWDVVLGRRGEETVAFELAGDRAEVLGPAQA